jgi:hypothetical protein
MNPVFVRVDARKCAFGVTTLTQIFQPENIPDETRLGDECLSAEARAASWKGRNLRRPSRKNEALRPNVWTNRQDGTGVNQIKTDVRRRGRGDRDLGAGRLETMDLLSEKFWQKGLYAGCVIRCRNSWQWEWRFFRPSTPIPHLVIRHRCEPRMSFLPNSAEAPGNSRNTMKPVAAHHLSRAAPHPRALVIPRKWFHQSAARRLLNFGWLIGITD